MLRAIILGLVLVVALGTFVPLATEYAEAGAFKQQLRKKKKKRLAKKYRRYISSRYTKRKKPRKYKASRKSKQAKSAKPRRYQAKRKTRKTRRVKRSVKRYSAKRYKAKRKVRKTRRYRKSTRRYTAKRKTPRVRKYSGKWWRSYRAKQNRRKAVAKRKRNMRLKRIRLAKRKRSSAPAVRKTSRQPQGRSFAVQNLPQNQMNYVQTTEGGDVSLDVLGPAVGDTTLSGRNQSVGGVSTTTLRRSVIDKMIQENGWVENDYSKDIGGRKVYVVEAKSADRNNRVQSRTFYFTESNGQIYRVSARAPDSSSEQVVRKSEKVLQTLQKPEERPVEQAQNK